MHQAAFPIRTSRINHPHIQRQDDPLLSMSITPAYAHVYSDAALSQEIERLQWYVIQPRHTTSAEVEGAQGNLQVLRNEQARRALLAAGLDTVAMSSSGTVEERHQAFIRRVLGEARTRLRVNQQNLMQWPSLVENAFSDAELYRQTYAQLASDLYRTATEKGTTRAYHAWAGTRGAHMRAHLQEQIAGRRYACMGCHDALEAEARDRAKRQLGAVGRAPMEQLPKGAAGVGRGVDGRRGVSNRYGGDSLGNDGSWGGRLVCDGDCHYVGYAGRPKAGDSCRQWSDS
jgi:hypothetical protein